LTTFDIAISTDGKEWEKVLMQKTCKAADGWKKLSRKIEVPAEAKSVTVELSLRWTETGSVQWRNPVLVKTEPLKHRKVKVATTLVRAAYDTLEENLDKMLKGIDKTAREAKPDILCLSESLYDFEAELPIEKKAETIPGKLTNAISKKARLYKCYIVFSMIEKDGNSYYQTGVLIGRKGEIAGKYRKTHIPLSEAEYGLTPGSEYPVFETDFGKIGIMVCWDQWFPEVSRILRSKGAEILFVPTMGYTQIQAPARAVDNGVYVVLSDYLRPNNCRIIDPEGRNLAMVSSNAQKTGGYAAAEIDLDKKFYSYGLSVGDTNGEPRSIYQKERRVDTYDELIGK
jgi:predicted amidohydrolase